MKKVLRLWGQKGRSPAHFCSESARLLAVSFALIALSVSWVSAQQGEGWADTIFLSEGIFNTSGAPASSMLPVLVADEWGDVHAFWVVKMDDPAGGIFDTLFYSRWRNGVWSSPIDILYYMPEDRFWYPQASVGSQGELYLVWVGGRGVWFSRALATEAGTARAWTFPVRLSEQRADRAAIAASSDGTIHIVYCALGEQGGEISVSHTSSTDGEHWTAPVQIWSVQDGCTPRLAIDGRGRLHVVFGDQPGLDAGTVVYYSRSDDSGQNWLPPVTVDRKDERYGGTYGPTYPSVATIDQDEIHIIWDGAPLGQRWHQWSADGGNTWTPPQQISPYYRGLTGPNAVAVDNSGTLHLVSMAWLGADDPMEGAYHAQWRDDSWSSLMYIGPGSENPTLTIVNGNVLHAAWWWGQSVRPIEIWTSSLQTDAPVTPPRPYPTLPVEPTAQTTRPAATAESVATAPSSAMSTPGTLAQTESAAGQAIWIGTLPTVLLVGLVILLHRKHRAG